MTLLVCWLVFPLVLGVLSLGCGLALEAASGLRLRGALLIPAGLAVIVVVGNLTTTTGATAELTTPVVIAIATVGLLLSPPWRRGTLDLGAVAAAAVVFAVFAAPVVLSGEATFLGYIKLDDTATWLALTDHVMEHGREVSLPPSSFEATVQINLEDAGYPWGIFPPLGIGHLLTDQDSAWLFQPYLALMAALLALSIYSIVRPLLRSRALAVAVAAISSQSALLFAYSLWGGVKELAAAWLLALLAAFGSSVLDGEAGPRSMLPLAVGSAAILAVLSFGGAAWLGPVLLALLVFSIRARGVGAAVRAAAFFLVPTALLSLPSLLTASTFLGPAEAALTNEAELGNLIEPLSIFQLFGIWPTGEFRLDPSQKEATYLLIAAAIAAALAGIVLAWRRGGWRLLLYLLGAVGGVAGIGFLGAPWVDAKAYAIASPAFLAIALCGAALLFEGGRRVEGGVLGAAIIAGVLWSNVLGYKDVNLAPRDRLAELERIGEQIAGEGPTLMTEYEPYGVRHFLREADPEGASELRRRTIPLRSGDTLDKIGYADIDQFDLEAVFVYRTLVLRRSGIASRPPLPYQLSSSDRYYEVWQRPEPAQPAIEHVPLGGPDSPGARADCSRVLRVAKRAGPSGTVAAVATDAPRVLDLNATTFTPTWQRGTNGMVLPLTSGTANGTITLPRRGHYGIWIGGMYRRRLELLVDGREIANDVHELSHSGPVLPLGEADLSAGAHTVTLRYGDADLHPGSGGFPFSFGPLYFSTGTANRPFMLLPASSASTLCGRRLDWIEAIGG